MAFKTAAEVLEHRDSKLPKHLLADLPVLTPRNVFKLAESLTPPDELVIVAADLSDLRNWIASRRVSAVQVLQAYTRRAVIAQQLVSPGAAVNDEGLHQLTPFGEVAPQLNCLTDFFYDEALARAQELDDILARTGKTVGPLHGVPISIKDHLNVAGRASNAACLAWSLEDKKMTDDSPLVGILRDAGAVLFCKTTIPQSIMQLETTSFLGKTSNPYDTTRSPGGSSGGEGALVALSGSAAGIGTDIGGSVRAPAGWTGLYGWKPSTGRWPYTGARGWLVGSEGMVGVIAPFARSLRDLLVLARTVAATEPWKRDPAVHPLPWRENVLGMTLNGRKLRVGWSLDDGVASVTPPVRRAIKAAVAALEKSGLVELVQYQPWNHPKGEELAHRLYFTDGGATVRDLCALSGEPVLTLTDWVLNRPGIEGELSARQIWALTAERNAFRLEYAKQWQAQKVDVVLCPTAAFVAPKHETCRTWSYTCIWNILDYPGVVIPSGMHVDPALDSKDYTTAAQNSLDEDIKANYDPEDAAGLPIGLQVVAYKLEDELALEAAALIEGVLRAAS